MTHWYDLGLCVNCIIISNKLKNIMGMGILNIFDNKLNICIQIYWKQIALNLQGHKDESLFFSHMTNNEASVQQFTHHFLFFVYSVFVHSNIYSLFEYWIVFSSTPAFTPHVLCYTAASI